MILFIDIDGTLNDYSYGCDPLAPWLMEKQCRCLVGLIYRLKENRVVLTSARRFMFSMSEWRCIFRSHGLDLEVIGCLERGVDWKNRSEGILSHAGDSEFLVLDDLNLKMEQQPVVIDSRFGLTPKDVDRIRVYWEKRNAVAV